MFWGPIRLAGGARVAEVHGLMSAFSRLSPVKLTNLALTPIFSPVETGRIDRSILLQMLHEASRDPDQANIFMRLSILFYALDQLDLGREMLARALEHRRIYRYRCAQPAKIRLLAIMGPAGGLDNAPIEYLLENSDIQMDLVFIDEDGRLPDVVPDHDVAIVALGESWKLHSQFQTLIAISAVWPRHIINQPEFVLNCSRDTLCQILSGVSQLVVPQTQRVQRNSIILGAFPKIIRPVDTHGGDGMAKVDNKEALQKYMQDSDAAEFYVSNFIDYRSSDGLFRKLRIALIDGEPYICHLAITEDWIVHFIPAGMELSGAKRAEEKKLMETFDDDFLVRHKKTLKEINARIGLDYVVLDCAVLRDGSLLLFEADSRAWIHSVDSVDVFPYKPAIMQKAFDAFRAMLLSRMSGGQRAS